MSGELGRGPERYTHFLQVLLLRQVALEQIWASCGLLTGFGWLASSIIFFIFFILIHS